MRRPSFPRALRLAIFTLLALFALPFMPASAQEATAVPENQEIKVAAFLCDDYDCLDFGDGIDGFTITAVDINSGEALASCVTDAASESQGCVLVIPADAQWELTYDEAQVPAGYTFHGVIAGDGGLPGPISYLAFAPVQDPELTQMSVAAVLCTDSECEEFGDRLGDVTITAVDRYTRETLGMCTTTSGTETQTCQLEVPANADLEFIADEDNIPAGYTFFGSVITIEDGPHGPITYLPFVAEDDSPDATVTPTAPPVKALPSTGSDGPDTAGSNGLGSIALALATVTLAGGALHLRRR